MGRLEQLFRPCVLVIDDDRAVCDVIVRLLHRAGFNAVGAYGGIAGVNAAERTAPDLVLVDLQMGDIDGRITLRLLRGQAPRAVILAFTGLFVPDEPLLVEGFDGIIRKPVPALELVREVTEALDVAGRLCRYGLSMADVASVACRRLRVA